jgi:hypothetical protein
MSCVCVLVLIDHFAETTQDLLASDPEEYLQQLWKDPSTFTKHSTFITAKVFDVIRTRRLKIKNRTTWDILLQGMAETGQNRIKQMLQIFDMMTDQGVRP